MAPGKLEFDIDHRKAPPIGRYQSQFVIFQAKKQPIENIPRFVSRNGIGSLAQPISQIFLSNRDDLRILKLRQRRKLFFRETENFEKALPTSNEGSVFTIHLELHFAGR